jgi:hypothetical protein
MHYACCMICIATLLGILHWEQNLGIFRPILGNSEGFD